MSVETKDASPRAIGITAALVLGGTWAVLGIAGLLWHGHRADRRPRAEQQFSYGPQDRPDVLKAWPEIEAQQREHLTTYGWVDRSAGVVRIPIDEAMKRLAAP